MNGRRPVPLPRFRRPDAAAGAGGQFSTADADAVLQSAQRDAQDTFQPPLLKFAGSVVYLCLAVSMFGLWLTVRHEHPFVGFSGLDGGSSRYMVVVALPCVVLVLLVVPLAQARWRSLHGVRGRSRNEQVAVMAMAVVSVAVEVALGRDRERV